MDGLGISLAFALTSVPAFLIARALGLSHARALQAGRRPDSPPVLGRLMRAVGIALLAGALAMLWAGADPTRVLAVALAMALVVNGLAVLMFVAVVRYRRRDGRR